MIIYLIGVIIYFLFSIIVRKDKQKYVLLAAAYMTGGEVYFRMTRANLLYETGKYSVILFCIMGIVYLGFKKNALTYIAYLLLLFPAILVSFDVISYDVNLRKSVLFNLSGPFCLSIVAIFCFGRTITLKTLLSVLDYIVYPLISLTVYVILYNPEIRALVTNTASNSALSGGFGPNQVATILGLGVFILLSRLLIPYKNILVHWTMMGIMLIMAFRALLTFSRGGVVTAAAMSVLFMAVMYSVTSIRSKARITFKFVGIFLAILVIWSYTSLQTGGLIENRYANEDALGREKADITTGRTKLLSSEMDAFQEHPFFGVGAGQVKSFYKEELDVDSATHNEISRMLAEHGMFGILALLILLIAPVATKIMGRKNIYFLPFLAFWGLTIAHSSMRIAAPAFIYGLALLNLEYNEKKDTVHREQTLE